MKIALTGGSGGMGRVIAAEALRRGHRVVSIDQVLPDVENRPEGIRFVQADICDYAQLAKAFEGCDALIHMAAIPVPGRLPDHVVHNNNVVGSYNALRAAAVHRIWRVCLASSVNAIGLAFSRAPRFDYFPVDERHPNYSEDPYSLSKWIAEQQADAFARRYEDMCIASLRFHYAVPERAKAARVFTATNTEGARQLWAYTRLDAAADVCLLSLEAPFTGHEALNIVAPDTTVETPSRVLAQQFYPGVPIHGAFEGCASFFNSSKAERLLGWQHKPATCYGHREGKE